MSGPSFGGYHRRTDFAGVDQLGTKGAYRAHVRVEDLTVRDAPGHSVGIQLAGGKFRLEDLTLERNSAGICCSGAFRGERLTIRDNRGIGVEASGITLSDFEITGSPIGVFTLPYNYLRRQSPKLTRGVLSGNGVDIRSLDSPTLRRVDCQHSEDLDGTPWGVCSED